MDSLSSCVACNRGSCGLRGLLTVARFLRKVWLCLERELPICIYLPARQNSSFYANINTSSVLSLKPSVYRNCYSPEYISIISQMDTNICRVSQFQVQSFRQFLIQFSTNNNLRCPSIARSNHSSFSLAPHLPSQTAGQCPPQLPANCSPT